MDKQEFTEALEFGGRGAVEITSVPDEQADAEGLPCGYCMAYPKEDPVRIRRSAHSECLDAVATYFDELARDREEWGGVL